MMDHVEVKTLLQEICNLLRYLKISSNDIYFISNTLCDFFIWLRSVNAELTQANIDVYLNSIFSDKKRTTSLNSRKIKVSFKILLEFIETKNISISKNLAVFNIEGELSSLIYDFLQYNSKVKALRSETIANRRHFLPHFVSFLYANNLNLDDITAKVIVDFFEFHHYTKAQKNVNATMLRQWFKWLYKKQHIKLDLSCFVPSCKYSPAKSPDRFTSEELSKLITIAQQDSSHTGMRNYAILLVLISTAMRVRDIVNLKSENIDWDNCLINFTASKNSFHLSFTLHPAVGNAIVRYLRSSRPKVNSDYIFLSHGKDNLGAQLSTAAVYSVIKGLCRKADIIQESRKGFGAHKIRATIASEAIDLGVPIHFVSASLGHTHNESTSSYIRLSLESLRACCLSMPPVNSMYYNKRYLPSITEEDSNG